jgi:hypothetical protein
MRPERSTGCSERSRNDRVARIFAGRQCASRGSRTADAGTSDRTDDLAAFRDLGHRLRAGATNRAARDGGYRCILH